MSKLCSNAANCGIKNIQDALPESLKTKVVKTINISTYVFVIKNKEQAKKLLKFLEDKGFSNISIDSKGTTITAQSSSGLINVNNYYIFKTPNGLEVKTYGTGCRAYEIGWSCKKYNKNQSSCSKHYVVKTTSGTSCIQCKWGGSGQCNSTGCNTFPVKYNPNQDKEGEQPLA